MTSTIDPLLEDNKTQAVGATLGDVEYIHCDFIGCGVEIGKRVDVVTINDFGIPSEETHIIPNANFSEYGPGYKCKKHGPRLEKFGK